MKKVTGVEKNQVTMLGRLFMLDMKNTLENKSQTSKKTSPSIRNNTYSHILTNKLSNYALQKTNSTKNLNQPKKN